MSRKWKFRDKDALYFISFAVVNWIDVFVRVEYKQALIESWKYCQQHKGLEIYGWCIMPSHIHMIFGTSGDMHENIVRDMKRHTSEEMKKQIKRHPKESRKEWMLSMMEAAGTENSNNCRWQFWQQNNKPIELQNADMALRALNYTHNNPVQSGFVENPEHWLYSSALDYAGRKGLVAITRLE
jgi:putative transposase